MKSLLLVTLSAVVLLGASPAGQTASTGAGTAKDVTFYSEAVVCYARLYLPANFSASSKAPAVVLAPVPGETAATLDRYASAFARQGIVAMAIDYRGWGKSGAYIYTAEQLRWDDRLRFSQHTTKVRLRRKRMIPTDQVIDIRNAITWIQGEPGVDRARVGVWGSDAAGGHVITTAATDARVKAVVAQVPQIDGKDIERKAWLPTVPERALLVKHARNGQPPATASAAANMNDEEARLAASEYRPFWYVSQIPPTTAVLFVVAEKDARINNEQHAIAASKLLKGPTNVVTLPGAFHAIIGPAADAASAAAVEWFTKHL